MKNGFFVLLMVVFAAGCGKDTEIKDKAAAKLSEQIGKCGRLVSLKKLDGVEGEIFGVKSYGIEFSANILLEKPCYVMETDPVMGAATLGMVLANEGPAKYLKQPGDLTVKGQMLFSKKESGWAYETGGAFFRLKRRE